jgi:hypothetical protein
MIAFCRFDGETSIEMGVASEERFSRGGDAMTRGAFAPIGSGRIAPCAVYYSPNGVCRERVIVAYEAPTRSLPLMHFATGPPYVDAQSR